MNEEVKTLIEVWQNVKNMDTKEKYVSKAIFNNQTIKILLDIPKLWFQCFSYPADKYNFNSL